MLDYITGRVSECAQWAHQSIKEIPVAGHVYTKFNDNVSALLWNLGCKGKDFAAPYFNEFITCAGAKIRQNPVIVVVVLTAWLAIIGRAIYKYRNDSK